MGFAKGEGAMKTFSAVVALAGIAALAVACSVDASITAGGDSNDDTGPGSAAANKAATDGVKSGDETDVDCGGSAPKKCTVGQGCKVGGDCDTGSCKAGTCAAPAPDDGVKNGDETDVDCGGAKAPKCAVAKGCAADADCASDACSYAKKCVASPSCVGNHGGDTCGENGKDDCCATVDISDGATFTVDKYQATAGRMRAFITKTNGDLQTWVNNAQPPGWNAGWTDNLPTNMDEALYALGPGGKRGCNVASQGGRTFAQDPIVGDPDEKSDFSQDVLDEKALNCVTWYMARALCAYDGKRLAKASEIRHLFTNGGTTTYPWQFQDKSAFNPNAMDERLSHKLNYETPNPPAGMRLVNNDYPLDHAFYMAPPGRFPKGADKYGVQDAAGNMLPWVNDGPKQFVWTFSWENHPGDLKGSTWNMSDGPDGYYAIGFRCAAD
jgi:formylglycine-generating enzyme required for sulfatase activity